MLHLSDSRVYGDVRGRDGADHEVMDERNRGECQRKRKRVELTIQEKIEIIRFKEAHPVITQVALRDYFSAKFNKDISRSSMSDLLIDRQRQRWLELDCIDIIGEKKRFRNSKYPTLEKQLHAWLTERISSGVAVSHDKLVSKAREFARILEMDVSNKYLLGRTFLTKIDF